MGGLGETLGQHWMQTLEGKNILFKTNVILFWDSNPGQIDDFHEMRRYSWSIYIRKILNLTT